MYISADGALVQAKRMEMIANNMANVETPGFKRDLALFQARLAEGTLEDPSLDGTGTIEDIGGGVTFAGMATSFESGPLINTGISTDMAIEGDGFFAVQKDGQTFLTRAGNFVLTPTGQLVTRGHGYPVLSDSGGTININPEIPWYLAPNGAVTQNDGSVTNLGIMQPESLGDLVKAGENLFQPLVDPQALPPGQRHVRQGYLEGSGVNPTREMMALIETSRAFEANMKLIQHQDEMINTLITELLGG